MIVLGHVPLSDCVIENDEAFKAQLSDAVPPPAMNDANVVKAAGTFALHSAFILPGHVITGATVSSIIIVCTHCPVLPHESAIVYVRVTVLGHVPLLDCMTEKDEAFKAQLSDTVPPAAINVASVENAGGSDALH